MLLRSVYEGLLLFKRAEHDHAGRITASPALYWLGVVFLHKPAAEKEIFVQIEIKVTSKCCFPCQLAFAVLSIAADIPGWVASVKVGSDIVRHIRNDELRFLDRVAFPPLHAIVV